MTHFARSEEARSTSAPPAPCTSTTSNEDIDAADPRCDPSYYQWYMSQHPRDPRVPRPIIRTPHVPKKQPFVKEDANNKENYHPEMQVHLGQHLPQYMQAVPQQPMSSVQALQQLQTHVSQPQQVQFVYQAQQQLLPQQQQAYYYQTMGQSPYAGNMQGVAMVPVMIDPQNGYQYVAYQPAPQGYPQQVQVQVQAQPLAHAATTAPSPIHHISSQPAQLPPQQAPSAQQGGRGTRRGPSQNINSGNTPHVVAPKVPVVEEERSPLMEAFRANKNRNMELIEIKGHVYEFSKDQEGSRFIQKKIESDDCPPEHKDMVYSEILKDALGLMTDVFGNYVIQKLLEYGNDSQKRALVGCMRGQVLNLTLQTYGCRVIQKALEYAQERDQIEMAKELDGYVLRCVLDQNGNHVIQKCIERLSPANIVFIVQAFVGNVQSLAVHAYGCRVIQRILEYCEDHPTVIQPILDEILATVNHLVKDQYGNYVVQHVVINGKTVFQYAILEKIRPEILDLAQHKFASNVVEKLFQYCDKEARAQILIDLTTPFQEDGTSGIIAMMKDQYANYVVQKVLETSDDNEKKILIDHIRPHIGQLRKFTYGKHIIARIEKGTMR